MRILPSLALTIIAAACFLLVAFGIDSLGPVGLLPLGLLFFALAFLATNRYVAAP